MIQMHLPFRIVLAYEITLCACACACDTRTGLFYLHLISVTKSNPWSWHTWPNLTKSYKNQPFTHFWHSFSSSEFFGIIVQTVKTVSLSFSRKMNAKLLFLFVFLNLYSISSVSSIVNYLNEIYRLAPGSYINYDTNRNIVSGFDLVFSK